MKIFILSLFLFFMYPEKRQVLIFYNQTGSTLRNNQLSELKKDAAGVKDREIRIETFELNNATAKKWNINIAKPFTVILIGKDGDEKLRSDTLLTTKRLFETIDAMPMRKREMENR